MGPKLWLDREASTTEAVVPAMRREAAGSRRFHVWMSGVCLAVAVIGFAPTYWLQLPVATFSGSPLIHLHGILFTAWPSRGCASP